MFVESLHLFITSLWTACYLPCSVGHWNSKENNSSPQETWLKKTRELGCLASSVSRAQLLTWYIACVFVFLDPEPILLISVFFNVFFPQMGFVNYSTI